MGGNNISEDQRPRLFRLDILEWLHRIQLFGRVQLSNDRNIFVLRILQRQGSLQQLDQIRWNEMLVKDNSKFTVKQSKCGRMYCRKFGEEFIEYPSVTTIISGKKSGGGSSPAMAIGTLVHYHILRRYTTKLLPKPTDHIWNTPRTEVVGRVRRCLNMWEDLNLNIKPICVETALFNHDPRYAGRLDMLAKLDGDLTLLDIKTGMSYDDHVLQAAAYWHALRRKPQVCFVYLDSIINRNPEQKAHVRYFTISELEKGYDDFLDLYAEHV